MSWEQRHQRRCAWFKKKNPENSPKNSSLKRSNGSSVTITDQDLWGPRGKRRASGTVEAGWQSEAQIRGGRGLVPIWRHHRPDVAAAGSAITTPGGLPAVTPLGSQVWPLKNDEFTDWFTDNLTQLFFYSSRWAVVWIWFLIAIHGVIYSLFLLDL